MSASADAKNPSAPPDLNEFITTGLLQAINLELLHPLGFEIYVVPGSLKTLEIRDVRPAVKVYGDDQLQDPYFLNARIAFLRFRRQQINARMEADDDAGDIFQEVPGRYCRHCGCTDDLGCRTADGGTCSWHVEPASLIAGGPIEPGICSECKVGNELEEVSQS